MSNSTPSTAQKYGVHSEVGTLRKVLVCSPGLAHKRLTPTNKDALLFDELPWVAVAKRDHFDFVTKMRDRGVDVVEKHELLAETLDVPEGKKWILDQQIVAEEVGEGLVSEVRGYLDSLSSKALAEFLIGGLSSVDLESVIKNNLLKLAHEATGVTEYLLPPLPNTIFTRDTTCWIYGGVSLNPLFCRGWRRARHRQWRRTDRNERAHFTPGNHATGRGAFQEGRREASHRGCDAQASSGHAPRYRVHILRPGSGERLPDDRRSDQTVHASSGRESIWSRSYRGEAASGQCGSDRVGVEKACVWSTPAAMLTRRSGNSGIVAIIMSLSRPG
jgi:hypothetical protein